jgi:drug/metabolite transporter (DMT)-like permease
MTPTSPSKTTVYLLLHLTVLIFGFTAIIGKLITLEQTALVWHRMWIAVVGLVFLPKVIKDVKNIPKKSRITFVLVGCLVAIHWLTFYGSIKLGNSASITLSCVSTVTLFTSILEPLIVKRPFERIEVVLGIVAIIGVSILTGVGSAFIPAIVVGLISAFFASLFSVLNKKYIRNEYNIKSVTFIELASGFIFITFLIPVFIIIKPEIRLMPTGEDWMWLLILGWVCTTLAFAISLNVLKYISAYVANLTINLEPIYGIVLAVIIFKENQMLNEWFYIGTSLVIGTVVAHPLLVRRKNRKMKK